MTTPIERYYAFHSRIYDLTRWSFLFGRHELIRKTGEHCLPGQVLEVGCGTGKNLEALGKQFPNAALTGADLSEAMLQRARKRLPETGTARLIRADYVNDTRFDESVDLVVFSYSLSMINPGWREAIEQATADLAPGGCIAVVDFHDSASTLFKRWMEINHVRMEAHLLPCLDGRFDPLYQQVNHAYGGLWKYFLFVGRKK